MNYFHDVVLILLDLVEHPLDHLLSLLTQFAL